LFKGGSRDELHALIPNVLSYNVSVLVVTGYMPPPSSITWCHQAGVPLLILNRGQVEGTSASVISCDHYQGGFKAAEALINTAKCRRVGMVCGTPETGANEARIQGFLNGLSHYGEKLWIAEEGTFSYSSGVRSARTIFSSPNPPDGLFCLNDEIALGVMDTARYEFGLSIPEDLAIIGYDDTDAASRPTYKLTTIKQPLDQLISESVRTIKDLSINPDSIHNRIIPVDIIYRNSLGQEQTQEP
jgi:DNA-binding LacI/PurR family transcriptional regulator